MEKKAFDEGANNSMTAKKVQLLESIGFAWAKRKGEHSWHRKYQELQRYHSLHGNCDVATKYQANPALGRWVSTQRSEYKKFKKGRSKHMTQLKIDKLELLGFKWEMLPNRNSGSSEDDEASTP